MLTATYGKKQYALLGYLLAQKRPEVATELLYTYTSGEAPVEQDMDKVEDLYLMFCDLQQIQAAEYRGPLHKSAKVEVRRYFIACILQLYCPQVFRQPAEALLVSRGLVKALCKTLEQQNRSVISEMIREVTAWYRSYPEFTAQTDLLTQRLKQVG